MSVENNARERSRRQLDFMRERREKLVVDSDVHITDLQALPPELQERLQASPDYFQGRPISVEDALWEMGQAGVDMALCLQNPAATVYCEDEEANFAALLAANRYISKAAERYPERIVAAGWTDPKALALPNALKLVDICVRDFGFAVIKMNPAQNAYPLDSELVLKTVDRIVEWVAVPAFHYGADTSYTTASALERVALRHPQHPLIGVHMGGGGASYNEADGQYAESRALGLRRSNIHFVLSAKRDTHIESYLIAYQEAGTPFCHNLSVASDAPYGRMSWNFGGYRAMFASLRSTDHPDPRLCACPRLFDDDAVRGYMGRNMVDLLIAAYERITR